MSEVGSAKKTLPQPKPRVTVASAIACAKKLPMPIWLAMALSIALMCTLGFWRYSWLLYTDFDLGIYHQVLWNTSHGRIFIGSFNEWTYIVDHREWLLLLLTPLYWVWADPRMLLVVQAIVLASGAIPMYYLAYTLADKGVFDARRVGIFSALLYLAHPTIMRMQLFEFHMLPWVVPLTLWLWLWVEARQRALFWVVALLLLLLREDVALMMLGVAVLLMWQTQYGMRREGVVLAGVSLAWFSAMVWLGGELSTRDEALFFQLYAWMGSTPAMAVLGIFFNPIEVLQHLLQPSALFLLVLFATSTGFLSLLGWRWLVPGGISWLVYALMGGVDLGLGMFYYHYGSMIAVWFFIAALHGMHRITRIRPSTGKTRAVLTFTWKDAQMFLPLVVLVCGAGNILIFGPQWVAIDTALAAGEPHAQLRADVARIPAADAVYASHRYWPLVSEREKLYPVMRLLNGTEHYSEQPAALLPVQWLLIDHVSFQYHAFQDLPKRRAAAARYRQVIADNQLVPVSLNAIGAVYGPSTAVAHQEEHQQLPVFTQAEGAVGAGKSAMHAITPTLDLVGYYYDTRAQQLLVTFRTHEPKGYALERRAAVSEMFAPFLPEDDALFLSLGWRGAYGMSRETRAMAIGYGVWLPSTWEKERNVTMRTAFAWPADQQDLTLSIGTLVPGSPLYYPVAQYSVQPLVNTPDTRGTIVLRYSCAVAAPSGDSAPSAGAAMPDCTE